MFVNSKSDAESNKLLNHAALEAINSAVYMEDYMDFVENIPDDIQRNITQLRQIDLEYQEILQDLDNYKNTLKKDLDDATRRRTLFQIQRALIKTQDLGDKKLQIAQAIQDIVDSKSRQLESDRMKLDLGRENETQNENSKSEQPERPSKRSRRHRHVETSLRDDSVHERHEKEIVVPSTSKTKKKKKRKAKVEKEQDAPPIEPPIDPDEPTYCLCDQVSYGEMIGCDNEDCEREWFHFSCVGLTTKPKGKWYCPTCRGDRSNQMRPKAV
ncbi:inhibitor of growth protein 1-like [Uloborus diversus]|uniref:inhibitor of growth protein 1-like n=1 Tax=Uloborus diversus TaxID=327109 RepID=UPI002409EE05|nr:inhibitor of growth protein 1-like [Uloborus diversus]